MGIEIERRFLVNDKWNPIPDDFLIIRQGYLSVDPERTIRVRTMGSPFRGQTCCFITIKGKCKGISRPEFEYEIPHRDAIELFKLCLPNIIEKTRYFIWIMENQWTVDVFDGVNKGLITAEIELEKEDQIIDPLPEWLGEEVSYDNRYSNSNLTTKPFTTW